MHQYPRNLASSFNAVTSQLPQDQEPPRRSQDRYKSSDSQSFQPEYHQLKKMGMKKNKNKIVSGGWTHRQNQIYFDFVADNLKDFSCEQQRRRCKVFFRLSKILRKRTPDQCRSHHQKLQLKYGQDLYGILGEIKLRISRGKAQEKINIEHQAVLEKIQEIQKATEHQFYVPPPPPIKKKEVEKPVAKTDWYEMRLSESTVKVSIDASRIYKW